MRKKRFTKFGIIIVGLAIVGMLMFSLPLMGAAATPEETTAAEKNKVKDFNRNLKCYSSYLYGGCVNTVMTEEVYSPKFNPLILQKKLIINTLILKNVKMVKL